MSQPYSIGKFDLTYIAVVKSSRTSIISATTMAYIAAHRVHKNALMVTALVCAIDYNGASHVTRLLLDARLQSNFITDHASQLN